MDVLPRNDLSAIHRPFLACEGLHHGASLPAVLKTASRPASSLKFNLRGRRYAIPANGCLVTLKRWPNLQRIQFGKSAQTVNPATVGSPEILPISPRRCVFSLDKSLSWMSFAKNMSDLEALLHQSISERGESG